MAGTLQMFTTHKKKNNDLPLPPEMKPFKPKLASKGPTVRRYRPGEVPDWAQDSDDGAQAVLVCHGNSSPQHRGNADQQTHQASCPGSQARHQGSQDTVSCRG